MPAIGEPVYSEDAYVRRLSNGTVQTLDLIPDSIASRCADCDSSLVDCDCLFQHRERRLQRLGVRCVYHNRPSIPKPY